jgi:hypothetical protein
MIETVDVRAGAAPAAQRYRTVERFRGQLPQQTHSVEQVEQVLRTLPSHGWAAGWIGRRDRALLVLSQFAGLSYVQIAALAAGDLSISDGVAIVRTAGGKTILRRADDDLLCGPCALARWVHALDLTVVYPDGRVIAALMPPVDQWGHPIRVVIEPRPAARASVLRATSPSVTTTANEAGQRALALEQRVEDLLEPGFSAAPG